MFFSYANVLIQTVSLEENTFPYSSSEMYGLQAGRNAYGSLRLMAGDWERAEALLKHLNRKLVVSPLNRRFQILRQKWLGRISTPPNLFRQIYRRMESSGVVEGLFVPPEED